MNPYTQSVIGNNTLPLMQQAERAEPEPAS